VIEDHPDGREALRLLLSLLGYRVEVAADGDEGVRKALEVRPQVVIVDVRLPKLDGYQVGRRLRAALGRSLTLIAHSASDPDTAEDRLAEAGFDAWLVKPAGLRELAPWLERARRARLTRTGTALAFTGREPWSQMSLPSN